MRGLKALSYLFIFSIPMFINPLYAAELSFQYDLDLLKNTQGGISRDFEYIDLLTLSASENIQLNATSGVDFYISAIYSNGHSFSEAIVGDDHVVSNLEGGARFSKLAEAWANYHYKDVSLLLGLYDINGEFDVLESAYLFLNSGHGIGNDIGLTGRNGPSIYPFYGLSARLKWDINSSNGLLLAITDGLPGDPSSPSSPAIEFNSDEGSFRIVEWQHFNDEQRWLFGAWQYSKSQAIDSLNTKPPESGNWGAYIRHERSLLHNHIDGFFRLGISNDRFNKYDGFVGAGLVFKQFVSARPNDTFGIALAYNHLGTRFAQSIFTERSTPPNFANGELNIELTYQTKFLEHIHIQPNLQYINQPAGVEQDAALVLGLRLSLQY